MMWVSQLFHLTCTVLAHVETKLEIPMQNVLLCWWGPIILGQFSVSPSPYSCTNTAPCFSCRGIRSVETLTCLKVSSITTPKQYKTKKEMCLKENINYKTNSFVVLVLHVVFSESFSYTCPGDLLVPKACIFRKTKYQKMFQHTSESWQHFTFLIFLECTNT